MNKKIVSVVLLLMVVYLVGIPGVSASWGDGQWEEKLVRPPHEVVKSDKSQVCCEPKPTETHKPKPTETHAPKPTETCKPTETHTPKPTVTQTPTPVPEFPSLILPIAAIMGLMMLLIYRRGDK